MKKKIIYALIGTLLVTPTFLSSCLSNTECPAENDNMKIDTIDLGNGILYEGEVKNGEMNGKGKIEYKNGDILNSEFDSNKIKNDATTFVKFHDGTSFEGTAVLKDNYEISLVEGTKTLKNNRRYSGKFINNLYDDPKGVFDFGTNTKYVGPFIKGSNVGLIGTIYYPPHVMNGEGVHFFTGEMASLGKFKENQYGNGKIKFGDKSVYNGGLHFVRGNEFYRIGDGIQDFTECSFNASIVGGPNNCLISKYVGHFDYTKTLWIYGNGVFYFTDYSLKPKGYLKGFYYGTKRAGDATIEIQIEEEYKGKKESTWSPENKRKDDYVSKYQGKNPDVIFCGDSYMDMWQNSFGLANYEEDTKNLNSINTGIGGTVGSEWVELAKDLIVPFNAKKIVIHLGFNDLHMGFEQSDIISNFKKIGSMILEKNSNAEIYFLGVEPSPEFINYFDAETQFNNRLMRMCDENQHFTFIDTQNLFIRDEKPIHDIKNYFSPDNVHMNKNGYELWWNKIQSYIK